MNEYTTLIIVAIVIILGTFIRYFPFGKKSTPEKELDLTKYVKNYSTIETDIVKEINEYRLSRGLSTLMYNNYISHLCKEHVDYCITTKKASHDNFPMRASIVMKKLKATSVGELVAKGYRNAESVVNAWKKSEGHHKELIKTDYNKIGINVREYRTKMYVVIILAKI